MRQKYPRILFVEDEPVVRFELKRFLERYSSEVITAENGEEGLALFKKYTPDIVVTDIKMPKMNGIEMAKKIKKDSPDQTIIFTTAHSDNSYFLEAIEMQVDGYILKPVDLGLLKKKINDICRNMEHKREKKLYESILDDIAQMQDTMLAVYDENGLPVFYNKKLLTFLGYKSIEGFLKKHKSLSEKFEEKEECYFPNEASRLQWVDEIKSIEADKRIVSIQGQSTTEANFFLVTLSDKTHSSNTIVTFSEITTMLEEKSQYKLSAYTDTLTQIHNRAGFNSLFEKMLKESTKKQSNLSIILLDIDNFKRVNDQYGHVMGDNVLKIFAKLILKNIRSADFFSRWGGEEFALLLTDTDIESAKGIAENLRLIIEQYNFGIEKQLTCSFGVAIQESSDTKDSLFERVDKALYEAKNNGRNRVISK